MLMVGSLGAFSNGVKYIIMNYAVTPGIAGEYLIGPAPGSAPTKNQALAALRHFFDALVIRHAVALNSFASVRRGQAQCG